jgi:hypothetical protein
MSQSFTVSFPGRMRELPFECGITSAFDPKAIPEANHPKYRSFRAIFDTGATHSVITQKVVDDWQLKPISMTEVHTSQQKHICEVYIVNIRLPNSVGFQNWRVTKQGLPAPTEVLLGMDIIGLGDFAVTHKNGKTVFSFRCPSVDCIDFVKDFDKPKPIIVPPHQERNVRCACGSGKKFKNCCGDPAKKS